jgi:hypothetical protein
MWLVVSFIAALVATLAFLRLKAAGKKYKLDFLALMLWGTFIMVLVDHSIAFLEGGPFIETTTDGLITSASLLGIAMVVSVLLVWAIAVCTPLGARICVD